MKKPKAIKRLCPYCKKHTEHKVTQSKKKNASTLSYGSKYRARARGKARGTGNLGRYSKPAVTKFKMTGKEVGEARRAIYEDILSLKIEITPPSIKFRLHPKSTTIGL